MVEQAWEAEQPTILLHEVEAGEDWEKWIDVQSWRLNEIMLSCESFRNSGRLALKALGFTQTTLSAVMGWQLNLSTFME